MTRSWVEVGCRLQKVNFVEVWRFLIRNCVLCSVYLGVHTEYITKIYWWSEHVIYIPNISLIFVVFVKIRSNIL